MNPHETRILERLTPANGRIRQWLRSLIRSKKGKVGAALVLFVGVLDNYARAETFLKWVNAIPALIALTHSGWFDPALIVCGLTLMYWSSREAKEKLLPKSLEERMGDLEREVGNPTPKSSPTQENVFQMARHAYNSLSPIQQEAIRCVYRGLGRSLDNLMEDVKGLGYQDDAEVREIVQPLMGSILIQKDTSGLLGPSPILSANPAIAEMVAEFLKKPRV